MRHSGAQLVCDAVNLKAQQHVGLDHVDLVAALHGRAIAVARGAVSDRPRLTTTERVRVCAEVAALKLLDQCDGRGQIGLLAVLAPGLEPFPIAPHHGVVGIGG